MNTYATAIGMTIDALDEDEAEEMMCKIATMIESKFLKVRHVENNFVFDEV